MAVDHKGGPAQGKAKAVGAAMSRSFEMDADPLPIET
jgi:hypothetical protein